MARCQLLCALLACAVAFCSGYYVPGTYPREFGLGDPIEVFVNSLTSTETELPFDYYSLPFCKPAKGVRRVSESSNLGTILQGVRIHNSPYNFSVKVDEKNKVLCPRGYAPPLKPQHVKRIRRMINQEYVVNMVLDNLPVVNYDLKREKGGYVRPGFLLGERRGRKYYINNHLVFNVLVHQSHGEYRSARENMNSAAMESLDVRKLLADKGQDAKAKDAKVAPAPTPAAADAGGKRPYGPQPELYMIVGFEVQPCSIQREAGKAVEQVVCDGTQEMQEVKVGESIVYTYDVHWEISKHKWASRWDAYLKMPGGKQVHWFSIVNSILVILVMAVICALILIRTIRRDLSQYEQLVVDSNSLDLKEEAGWKLVAGDVFRAPADALGLAVQVGAGVQIISTFSVTLFLATLGFLSPASRGALVTTLMIMYVLLAIPAGAAAAYTHALMERAFTAWSAVAWRTSLYFSGTIFALFTILNLVIHHTGSSGAVPFTIYLTLALIWFLVSVPLTFFGAYSATKLPLIDWPVKTNQIPRHVPEPPAAAHPWLLMAAAGILPFGALFIELYFIMTSVWLGFFFYLFGFVFLIGLLTIIICSEIAILTTYVQLCAEDYLWWWRSFHRGGSVAIYIGLHALTFLFTTLKQLSGFVSVFIYLTYMSMAVFAIYLALGTVGFASSLWFVYTIFKAVKQD